MSKLVIDFLKKTANFSSNKRIFAHIVQIGTGANGGPLVQQVAQMISTLDVDAKYVIADNDIVEDKNLRNQLFIKKDVGKPKADVLARRYSAAYQVDIAHYSEKYVEDIKTLESLFDTSYLGVHSYRYVYLPILISCVDNKFSRKLFHQYFEKAKGNLLYLDVGNESVILPEDRDKPREEWTEDEIEAYNKSGYTGQVVAGLKLNGTVITEPIASLFPQILDIDENDIAPSATSCGEVIASDPQRLITNRYASLCVSTYLNELFSEGTLSNHITFFHAKRMYMRTEPIKPKEENLDTSLVG
ncbi:ThiF family adenylyltransferase [Viridibacillus arvi]|uniref:ThiF family adenylyltransferase n=1 Tax=Viridibacillus arvi TaxID=263475 RepID=UPI0034CE7F6E